MEKKDKIINIFEYYLNNSIYGLDKEEVMEYLLDDVIPNRMKKILANRLYIFSYKEKNEIWENFYNRCYHEDEVYNDVYPVEFLAYVADKKYGCSIGDKIKAIRSNELLYEEKKLIIDTNFYDNDYVYIYNALDDSKLKEYIIDEKLDSSDRVCAMIHSNDFPLVEKEKIIKRKINCDNYLDIMVYKSYKLNDKDRDLLYDRTTDIAKDVINNIKKSELIPLLRKAHDGKFIEELLLIRNDDIDNALYNTNIFDYQLFLETVNNKSIANNIINRNIKKTKRAIHNVDYSQVFNILNNENLPYELRHEVMILNKKAIKKAIINKNAFSLIVNCLKNDSLIEDEIKLYILDIKRNSILDYFKDKDKDEIIYQLNHKNFIYELNKLIIDNIIDNEDLPFIIENCNSGILDLILLSKRDYVRNKLSNYSTDKLFFGKIFRSSNNSSRLINFNKDIVIDRINGLVDEEVYKYLENDNTLEIVRSLMIERFGYKGEDTNNFISLLEYNDCKFLMNNYYKIKSIILEMGLDFNAFIQYGSGSNKYKDWANKLIDIVDNDKDVFLNVFNYLINNYYVKYKCDENVVYTISSSLEIISIFKNNYKLLTKLACDNVLLSSKDMDNLKFVFRNCKCNEVVSLLDIDDYRNKCNDLTRIIISNTYDIELLRKKYLDELLSGSYECLVNIGGTRGLKMLKNCNIDSSIMIKLIDDVIRYSEIIEYGMDTNDFNSLKKILKYYYFDNVEELSRVQDEFALFEEKVRYLFETDARVNFTSTLQMDELARDNNLENKYGGIVYNLSDKNYILYAHILSGSETVQEVINGFSTGKKNFISMSAISYMGEKYYYDHGKMIFAFNDIPKNSFICSSVTNMGTNYNIRNNSLEVNKIERTQRGILETSVSRHHNSEVLLYRNGVRPMGLVLPGGREPTKNEIICHNEYGLPFIITQNMKTTIENTQMIFRKNDILTDDISSDYKNEIFDNLINRINMFVGNKKNETYTGREIALFTDIHALYEPTLAVLEDIRRNGIKEIYSLGDNVGSGPNPREVIELLNEYGVISVAGNSEYYNTLGVEPFGYLDKSRLENQEWTYDKLGNDLVSEIKMYPASLDILVGNKKIALCHFANDVRWDYRINSTWTYQDGFVPGVNSRQFLYTNSDEAYNEIKRNISGKNNQDNSLGGYQRGIIEPLFNGKKIYEYDSVIQGHVHYEVKDYLGDTDINTLRALGMGYIDIKDKDVAVYYVLREKVDGEFELVRKNVMYDRYSMLANINSCNMPGKEKIKRFVNY